MGFLDDLLLGASGVTSLGGLVTGLFGGGEGRARAERERQLASLERAGMSDYLRGSGYDQRDLYARAGAGADAVSAFTGRLGDSLAGGGVYNASTVAGAGLNAGREELASLAYLSAQQSRQRQEQLAQNQRQVTGARLGYADQDVAREQSQRQGSIEGFMSFLGALSQYNNAQTGVTQQQRGVPGMNGTQQKLDYIANPQRMLPPAPGDFKPIKRPTLLPSQRPTTGIYGGQRLSMG